MNVNAILTRQVREHEAGEAIHGNEIRREPTKELFVKRLDGRS
jgi:hypothetical protein